MTQRRALLLPVAALFFLVREAEVAPPSALFEKSVVVDWTEQRSQRDEGETRGWHQVTGHITLNVYISAAGRVFSRQINRTKSGSGDIDRIAGEGRTPPVSFAGQTMTIIRLQSGSARRIVVDFDSTFSSCTAKASMGFEAGKTSISLSPITKKHVEIRSLEAGSASCQVRSGNVLAGT
jgi:hypothetical protein